MTKESGNHQYVSYPMFKGLQKPLEFMGFQGRYITWAAATVGIKSRFSDKTKDIFSQQ